MKAGELFKMLAGHSKRRRHGLDCGELTEPGGDGGVPNDGHACHSRHDLFEQL